MESLKQNLLVFVSLIAPTIFAWISLSALCARLRIAINPFGQFGLAYFLGMWTVAGLLYVMHSMSGTFAPAPVYAILACLSLGAYFSSAAVRAALANWGSRAWNYRAWKFWPETPSADLNRAVIAMLIAFIAIRLIAIFFEVYNRPTFPWDAWATWAYKSRIWFEFGQMMPFVDAQDWLSGPNLPAFNIDARQYPNLVPLVHIWPALHIGVWNEPLLNLPWFFCLLAILSIFYGFLRQLGQSRVHGLLATALLVSIPLLHVHTALAGYADIWLAGAYLLGVIGVYSYFKFENRAYLLFVLVSLLALMAIKREGLILAPTLFLPLVWRYLRSRPRHRRAVFASIPTAFVLLAAVHYFELLQLVEWKNGQARLSLPYIGDHLLEFKAPWSAVYKSFFGAGTWNLFWFVVPGYLLLMLKGRSGQSAAKLTLLAPLASLFTMFIIFTFTNNHLWLESGTAFNRTLLPAALGLLLCAAAISVPRTSR